MAVSTARRLFSRRPREMLRLTKGMDAIPSPPPSLATAGERATAAPREWLRAKPFNRN